MSTVRFSDSTRRWKACFLCLLGVVSVGLAEWLWSGSAGDAAWMVEASARMQHATAIIASVRAEDGPAVDPASDINGTGLIGAPFSPMTTTVGNLEAKRTTTNPNMAALMVYLLKEAGVQEGDFIAVGASGSFPSLTLATLCASETMHLGVGLIVSLGASQWGANLLGFTWLDIEDLLYARGMLSYHSAAAAIGGDLDVGRDLDHEVRETLRARIEASTAILIDDPSLTSNVTTRMATYQALGRGQPIAAFVNIGGAWANLGTDASVLKLSPGVSRVELLPPAEARGVIHAMAALEVPIVHLLNIKGLVLRFGLPWDPSPLPEPGTLRIRERDRARPGVIALGSSYLLLVSGWLVWVRVHPRRGGRFSAPP